MIKYTRWLDKLDKILSKPESQELMIVYWWGWTWKTEWSHFIARANADKGIKVCYISLEMPREQLARRYAIRRAGIKSYYEYQEWKYTDHQKWLIEQYYKEFIDYPNIALVWEDKWYTLQDLISEDKENVWLMTYYYDMGYRMFIVDNLWKIETSQKERDAQAEISSKLQTRKNKYNTNIIVIHHTGKKKTWVEASMRGSQKIYDCATRVIKLERDNDPQATPALKCQLKIYQEKFSMRGNYEETECYFDRGVYVEEFVWNLYKNTKIEIPDEVF